MRSWLPPVLLAVAAAAVLGVAMVYYMAEGSRALELQELWTGRDYELIGELQALSTILTEAESNQRSYLLTAEPQYLEPFLSAGDLVEQRFLTLKQDLSEDIAADRKQLARLQSLHALVMDRLTNLDRAVELQKAGKHAEALDLLRANSKQNPMTEIRARMSDIIADEAVRLESLRQEQHRRETRAIWVAFAGCVFSVVAMSLSVALAVHYWRQRRRAEAALAAARDAALSADQAKSRFLATASHDLRQPLHALNLFISALRRRVSGAEAVRLVDSMATATRSMQLMFNALLDVSKLHAGAVTPVIEDVAVEDIFARLRNEFEATAAAKGLKLVIPSSQALVRTDPALLESILRNLISNAVRYTRNGHVLIRCARAGTRHRFEVEDTGRGIPADKLDVIFDEFSRLDNADVTERGLGLGLAIVRRLVALLGLEIEVRSTAGEGSTFAVEVPGVAEKAKTNLAAGDSVSITGRRLLVIEDDALVREAIVREAQDWQAEVAVAATAEEAMTLVSADRSRLPEVAIVDRNLGTSDGLDLMKSLEARCGIDIPTIIVTGATDPESLGELRRSGRFWMTKPIESDTLKRAVADLLALASKDDRL